MASGVRTTTTARAKGIGALALAAAVAVAGSLVVLRAGDGGAGLGALGAFARKVVGRIGDNLHSLATGVIDTGDRFCALYLLASLAFAAVAFVLYESRQPAGGFLRFLFPRAIYLHRSARIDYAVFLINKIFSPAVLITRLFTAASIGGAITGVLIVLFGPYHRIGLEDWAAPLVFTLATAMVTDLGDYLSHALHHHVPLLWQFHKLHHSAEVMTPITVARVHPVEQVVGATTSTVVVGIGTGIAGYFLLEMPQPIEFLGAQVVSMAFMAAGSHLRHSHVWLSWGRALSHIVISPAQHQIHHSVAPEHWDRNFGFMFALWDWLFGTLYVPRARETIRFGVAGADPALHGTVWAAYVEPFRAAGGIVAGWFRRDPK